MQQHTARWSTRAALALALLVSGSVPALARDVVVHAGHLFDSASGRMRERVSVVIHDNRVVAVEDGYSRPAAAEVIDLSAMTVLPGLTDAHTHVTYRRGGFGERLTGSDLDDTLRGVYLVPTLLVGQLVAEKADERPVLGGLSPAEKARAIVAVAGDPLADITELERVRFVLKGGEIVRRD